MLSEQLMDKKCARDCVDFLTSNIKKENVIGQLLLALEMKSEPLIEMCLTYLNKHSGTTFSLYESSSQLTLEVDKDFDSTYLTPLLEKDTPFTIDFTPTESVSIKSLTGFVETFGENIQTLDLIKFGHRLTDELCQKFIQNCPNLNHLFIKSDIIKDEALQGLAQLTNLQTLDLHWCYSLTSVDGLAQLPNLQTLDLYGCKSLTSVDGLAQLPNLQTLDLSGCNSLTSVDGLAQLPNLQTLNLRGCRSLTSVDGLAQLPNLQTLNLRGCDSLTSVDGLAQLPNLQTLDLHGCYSLTSVDGLAQLSNLQTLDLGVCYSLTSVDGLAQLPNLQTLDLGVCKSLTSVDGLAQLTNLQTLDLHWCKSLTSVDGLAQLPNLQTLNLWGCKSLTSVDGLDQLPNLQTLDLRWCDSLTSVDGLAQLSNLQTLNLSGCYSLTSVDGLAQLPNLQTLDLRECKSLTSVDGLAQLPNLQTLDLRECKSLTSVDGLAQLPNLQTLYLSGCSSLTSVDGLAQLAAQGNAEAQYNLGLMYEEGRGVEQNDELAVKWYLKAADQGHEKAKNQFYDLNKTLKFKKTFFQPKLLKEMFQSNFILKQLDIGSGGRANNTWEKSMKSHLLNLSKITTSPSLLLQELYQKRLSVKKCEPVLKTTQFLQELREGSWTRDSIAGRTEIFKNNQDGTYLAVKWQKSKESLDELLIEAEQTKFFAKLRDTLFLRSLFPEVDGVFEFSGRLPQGYFDDFTVGVKAKNQRSRRYAYIYRCKDKRYFTYLHDPSIPNEDFEKARLAALHDVYKLASNGLLMTALADLFHNRQQVNSREDAGRYMPFPGLMMPGWRTGRGSGRLEAWRKSVEYINERMQGLADVGDSEFLSDLLNPKHPLSKKFFSTAFSSYKKDQIPQILLANFLGEYQLVDELLIGRRFHDTNGLDWKSAHKINVLREHLIQGAAVSWAAFTGVSTRVAKRFAVNSSIQWRRYARQISFWLVNTNKGYLPHVKKKKIPKVLYRESVEVTVSKTDKNWTPKGYSKIPNEPDIGPYNGPNPIKEGEKVRAIGVLQMIIIREAMQKFQKKLREGEHFLKNKSIKDAITTLNDALAIYPYSEKAYRALSKAHQLLGDKDESSRCLKQAAALTIQHAFDRKIASSAVIT